MKYLIYTLLVVTGLCLDRRLIYFLFFLLIWEEIIRYKKISSNVLLAMTVYSLILPDNYVVEFMFLLYFIVTVATSKLLFIKRNKFNLFFILIVGLGVASTIINFVPATNVLFALFSILPLFLFFFLIGNEPYVDFEKINGCIDKILFIESIATVVNFILNLGRKNDDWSCGTFSVTGGQQAQLFIIMAFLIIYNLSYHAKNIYNKKMILRIILAGLILLSTNCWTLLALFILGITVSNILILNRKKVILIFAVLIILPIVSYVTYSMLPERITSVANRILSDNEYFDYRFHKATVYKETFVEIPCKDLKFLLIGNGLGYYASRGALICTGKYTEFYDKMFSPSVSKYTDEYIMHYLELAYYNGGSDYGSVLARPYSSFIALLGESGYIGFILFIALILSLLKGKSMEIKTLIIIWLAFSMAENYFEYSKVIVTLYACMISMQKIAKKQFTNSKRLEKI